MEMQLLIELLDPVTGKQGGQQGKNRPDIYFMDYYNAITMFVWSGYCMWQMQREENVSALGKQISSLLDRCGGG